MQNIILREGIPRGFFSNLTTILTCSRYHVNRGVDLDNIYMGSDMFSLYGSPDNWFEPQGIGNNGISADSREGFDLEKHSTTQQLDLLHYLNRFPWNCRVQKYLQQHVNIPKNTLGLHFRGTDHNYNDATHGSRVDLDIYLKKLAGLCETNSFDSVFLCSDESAVLDKITNFLIHVCGVDDIIINPVTRITGSAGLHWTNLPFNKVKLADEVILDAHCLAACNTVIGKTSNLINFARILTPSLDVHYTDL